jgi:hypothetical protein
MWHMPGGNVLAGGLAMLLLIVKENIRTECFQECAFIHAAEE